MSNGIYRPAFQLLCALGRPIGGLRPRRIYHALAQRAFPQAPGDGELRWHRDRWGHRFLLHPYYLIDRHIVAFGAYEADMIEFLRRRLEPGMVCLDIGANLGEIAVNMGDRVGPTGRVHAFEPVPTIAERLRGHIAANDLQDIVKVHTEALCDKQGTTVFHTADSAFENQGMAALRPSYDWLQRKLEVKTSRIDDFVVECGLERLDWIKADVQGAEVLLLDGASDTLSRLRPRLLLELSPVDLDAFGHDAADLLERLDRHDYDVFSVRAGRPVEFRRSDVSAESIENLYCAPA